MLLPNRTSVDAYNFGAPDDAQWLGDEITGHKWQGKKLSLQVRWNLGDTNREPVASGDEPEALDHCIVLMGVTNWQQLSRKIAA